jgi:hypothetical protein
MSELLTNKFVITGGAAVVVVGAAVVVVGAAVVVVGAAVVVVGVPSQPYAIHSSYDV